MNFQVPKREASEEIDRLVIKAQTLQTVSLVIFLQKCCESLEKRNVNTIDTL